MTNNEDLRLIHLAKLPEILSRGHRVHPTIVKALLMAIAIDTDNGRHPTRIADLSEAAGIPATSTNYLNSIVAGLVIAGVIKMAPKRRRAGIGLKVVRSLEVDFAVLSRLARLPLTIHGAVRDPQGVATLAAPLDLLKLRDRVCDELGVGLAFIGKVNKQESRDPTRCRLRGEVCRRIMARWKARGHDQLDHEDLGHLLGVHSKSIRHSLTRYPATQNRGAAA